jgi:hypothetical protein
MNFRTARTLVALSGIAISLTSVTRTHAEEMAPKKPPLPPIIALKVQPATLTLQDARDARSVIVTGQAKAGYAVDLSPVAKLRAGSDLIRVDANGYVVPVKAGKTTLIVTAAGKEISVPVTVQSITPPPVSFVREVMPVMSRVGCNAGLCHGSAKGKNGFKLSLRGYDPDFDHHALIDDVSGRRFNRSDPAQSLMLLKPTGAVPHRGGVLFTSSSPYYVLLKRWISEGAKTDADSVKRVSSLEVLPTVPNVTLPGMTQKMLVIAHYPDGKTRDVTREAVFTSSLPEVATMTTDGTVSAVRRGEAACLVRYEGAYAANNITVLGDRSGYKWAAVPENSYIDRLVDKKLQKVRAQASGLCDDATFVRRAYLDLTGLLPTPEATRAYLEDKTPSTQKREQLTDMLLASDAFNERWTNKWSDLLDSNSKFLGDAGVRKFRNWIRASVAENKPYNKFVRELITASGDANLNPSANYMRVVRDTSTATENVTQLFLGVRFSCAKCHDHPFERWTQNQYYQFGAFFAQVGYKPGAPGTEVVFNKGAGEVMHPKTGLAVLPAVPVGRLATLKTEDRRQEFADWLTSKQNPFFSRAYVNRLWSYFLGKGIIDPVDDIRASNPATNPELLEALNTDFVQHGFDTRHIMRTIVLSRTYQSELRSNRWNADDHINFSHAAPRRLEAEQLYDALHQATGSTVQFAGLPAGTTAEELPDAKAAGDGFLDLFGKPVRETPCECERSSTVSLGQALNLINGPTLSDSVAAPTGRIAQLLKTNPTDEKVVEEIFLSTLSRFPTAKEKQTSLATLHVSANRGEGAEDLMWALLNSPAFLFNR